MSERYIDPSSGAAPQPGGQVGGRHLSQQPTPEEYGKTQFLQNPEETEQVLESTAETTANDEEETAAEEPAAQEDDLEQYATGGGWYEIDGEKYQGKNAARKALKG